MGNRYVSKEGFERDTTASDAKIAVAFAEDGTVGEYQTIRAQNSAFGGNATTVGENISTLAKAITAERYARVTGAQSQDKIFVEGDNGSLKLNADNEVVKQTTAIKESKNANGDTVYTKEYNTVTATDIQFGHKKTESAEDKTIDKKANVNVFGSVTVSDNIQAASGTITAEDDYLITGSTVYNEVHIEDGNYVKATNTAAANLAALDTALKSTTDDEISARKEADETLTTNLASEVSARETAVSDEEKARKEADETLTTNLSAEVSARETADTENNAALQAIKNSIGTVPDGETIIALIDAIKEKNNLYDQLAQDDYEDYHKATEGQTVFNLKYTPIGKVRMYINGQRQFNNLDPDNPNELFTVEDNVVTWAPKDTNAHTKTNQYQISLDDEIVFEYDYDRTKYQTNTPG